LQWFRGTLNLPISHRDKNSRSERGYVLLVLLLMVAVLSIGFLAAVQKLEFRVRRDREEEMIHRGVQYSRAIRRFYKKFGRYPTRIEELENSSNLRFLRKRYKDPLNRDPKTGEERDFKILHLQDVQTSFSSTPTPGVAAVSDIANGNQEASSDQVQGGAPGALNSDNAAGVPSGPGPSAIAAQSSDQGPSNQTVSAGTPPAPQPLSQQLGANGAPQVFGGGAIVGVASSNKDKSIRIFNKKDHYNQWQFIYDPMTDRGGLLMTPNQPPLQNAAQNLNVQQQNGQTGFSNPSPGFTGPNPQGINSPGGNSENNNSPPQPNMPPDQNQ
jgi:type II secretory pathway pseudopilin PulG